MLISYLPVHHRRTVWQSRGEEHWLIWSTAALCHIVELVQRHVAYLLTKHSWCDFIQMLPANRCCWSFLLNQAFIKRLSSLLLIKADQRIYSDRLSCVYFLVGKLPVTCYTILAFSKFNFKCARSFPQSLGLINDLEMFLFLRQFDIFVWLCRFITRSDEASLFSFTPQSWHGGSGTQALLNTRIH